MPAIEGWSQPVDATLYLEGEMECGLMVHKFHRGFTAAEKTELWDRWKRGESLKAIGRAFGKQSSSIYFLVEVIESRARTSAPGTSRHFAAMRNLVAIGA